MEVVDDSTFEEVDDSDFAESSELLTPVQYEYEQIFGKQTPEGRSARKIPSQVSSNFKGSAEQESEYNFNCSSGSSPEHKIHTVVVGSINPAVSQS